MYQTALKSSNGDNTKIALFRNVIKNR